MYIQTGQGMLRTIDMSAQKDGYTMTDRGTWIKYVSQQGDNNRLKIVVEGDKTLFNQYSVITINKEKCKDVDVEAATSFTNWIVMPENQKFIADFKLLGMPLFVPNAGK